VVSSTEEDDGDSGLLVSTLKDAVQSQSQTEDVTDDGETEDLIDDDDNDDDDDGDDGDGGGEWEEMAGKDWTDLPFELQCVDAVLHVVSGILSEDTSELQEAALSYIQRLLRNNGGMDDDPLTLIRAIKDAIREMRSRVKGFVKSITRILNEDEDMALMNLSRLRTHPEVFIQPVPQEVLEEESDEPELILEAYLQITFTLQNALDLIQGQVDTASELVDQKLDAVRNRILYANMVISVISLCVASASLIGSFFGMNLLNELEDSPNAFKRVVSTTVAAAFCFGLLILAALVYSGAIPRTRFQSEM
jgi:magnesium transporter